MEKFELRSRAGMSLRGTACPEPVEGKQSPIARQGLLTCTAPRLGPTPLRGGRPNARSESGCKCREEHPRNDSD